MNDHLNFFEGRTIGASIPDRVRPGLAIIFCGINPGLFSAAAGYHFARPGNRFWPAIYAAGFTDRLYAPTEAQEFLDLGYGLMTLVHRATRSAKDISRIELRQGADSVQEKLKFLQPGFFAFLGIGAYRVAFHQPGAQPGPQPISMGATRFWLLPEPSGLNVHYPPSRLAAAFGALREAVMTATNAETKL